MNGWTNFDAVLKEPTALKGLDVLMDRARRVLDRYMRIPMPMPVRKPEPKPLGRTA